MSLEFEKGLKAERTNIPGMLVFDLPVDVGLERAFGRGLFETRFESKGVEFHQRLRDGFLRICEAHPQRCVRIDAVGTLEEVEARVWAAVVDRLL